MVTLDALGSNEQVWIIGGNTPSGPTYKTHKLIGENWEKGPDLIYGRQEHACAVIESKAYDNKELIVVAGGRDEFGRYSMLVEFHISGTQYWFRGKLFSFFKKI